MEKDEGAVPDSLDTLVGNYLPDDLRWRNALLDYSYQKISPSRYKMVTPPIDRADGPSLVFTDEGLKVLGME
jgi:hypothetical protein